MIVFFFKQKTAYEMRISDWSSDVCSSDLLAKLDADGVDAAAVAKLLDAALIAPVLTAHPTEVRRKSMLDHKNRIAELMRLRDAGPTRTPRAMRSKRRCGGRSCSWGRPTRSATRRVGNAGGTPGRSR